MQIIFIEAKNFSKEYINLLITLIPSSYKVKVTNKDIDKEKTENQIIFGSKKNETDEKIKFWNHNNKGYIYVLSIDELTDFLK
jgi:hypothetical protein